jgi:hypothetical protein
MSENLKPQDGGVPEQVGPDTKASILQATFQHYFGMAMDHHTKAGTTSNVLLIIVAAISSFVGLEGIGGTADIVGGLVVLVIGLFGAVWSWKQHERYYFWQHVAQEYQAELTEIVPGLKMGCEYYEAAQCVATEKYTAIFARKVHERWLWVSLHGIVAAIGLGLIVLAAGRGSPAP